MFSSSPALFAPFAPRSLDQDAAHRLAGCAEKVRAILKRLLAEPQPRFMHKRRRLECVSGLLASHFRAGERAQLRINLREQRALGVGLTALNGLEKESDIGHAPLPIRW